MPDIKTVPLPSYPGIVLRYVPEESPFFEKIVLEALKRIKALPTGAKLLALISKANPEADGADDPEWPSEFGCRVLIVPPTERVFIQDGYRRMFGNLVPTGRVGNRPFNPTPLSGSCNNAIDQGRAGNGKGSIARLAFNNTVMKTSGGEVAYPFVVLAHELIHAYHTLYGIKKDGRDEELCTTGIGAFATEELSENKIRGDANLPLRTKYFA